MQEIYRGYKIDIQWSDESLGYSFQIYNKDEVEVSSSIDPYMYMENALIGAKEVVDNMQEA